MEAWEEMLAYIDKGPNRTRKFKDLKRHFQYWPKSQFVQAHGQLLNKNPPAVDVKLSYLRANHEYTATNAYCSSESL